MKALIQTFLISSGILGLLFGALPAWIAWKYCRAFGESATLTDKLTMWSPVLCILAISIGVIWKRKSDAALARNSSNEDNPPS